jgi:hypothetical protein
MDRWDETSKRGNSKMTDQNKAALDRPEELVDLIESIADEGDPARLLEVYYWSREPGFLEIVRTFAAMPEAARAAIEAFVSIAHDPSSITATWDRAGRLTLTSPQVGQAIAIVQHCAENDESGTPPLLN